MVMFKFFQLLCLSTSLATFCQAALQLEFICLSKISECSHSSKGRWGSQPYTDLQVQVLLSLNQAAANADTLISNIFTSVVAGEWGFLAPEENAVHTVDTAML